MKDETRRDTETPTQRDADEQTGEDDSPGAPRRDEVEAHPEGEPTPS